MQLLLLSASDWLREATAQVLAEFPVASLSGYPRTLSRLHQHRATFSSSRRQRDWWLLCRCQGFEWTLTQFILGTKMISVNVAVIFSQDLIQKQKLGKSVFLHISPLSERKKIFLGNSLQQIFLTVWQNEVTCPTMSNWWDSIPEQNRSIRKGQKEVVTMSGWVNSC